MALTALQLVKDLTAPAAATSEGKRLPLKKQPVEGDGDRAAAQVDVGNVYLLCLWHM